MVFRPLRFIAMYRSSFPGKPASAIVTCTPRTSRGSGRGCKPSVCDGFGVEREAARTGLCLCTCVAITPPMTPAAMSARSPPAMRRRLLWRRWRASARRTLYRALGSTGWRTLRGALGGLGGLACGKVWKSNSSRTPLESPCGPLRSHDCAPPGRGPDRDRAVRRLAASAVERRRARRPLFPGFSQQPLPLHRRARGAGRPHRAGRRSEEHTSELQSLRHLVCRLLLETKKQENNLVDSRMKNKEDKCARLRDEARDT